MSTEQDEGISRNIAASPRSTPTNQKASKQETTGKPESENFISPPGTPVKHDSDDQHDQKPAARQEHMSDTTSPSTQQEDHGEKPRQVIAVSASKGPAAFFNLARKFLVTDDMCDLSALEGAIVSAVDAAHLLERSKLATIVRVQTSYVTVEPKRRKQPGGSPQQGPAVSTSVPVAVGGQGQLGDPSGLPSQPTGRRSGSGRELRRARIVITVKRTESYKQWLEENPLQAIIAGDGDDVGEEHAEEVHH